MKVHLRPLNEQTLVITGASSGIGLATARMAVERGARVVLASRNEEALAHITGELVRRGGEAIYVVTDVAMPQDIRRLGEVVRDRFGGVDTWINNAGVSVYGRIEEVALEDFRQLFEINFWGLVYGSLVAAQLLRARSGGALVNLGSELSDVSVPLQGMYAATKHAVKAFTDSLRMELEADGAPISVTLIKPAAIDTLFTEHAKNYMPFEPKLPAPVYAPEVAADAILYAAEHPKRDIYVGGAAKMFATGAHYLPRTVDRYMERFMFKGQQSEVPAQPHARDNLYGPGDDLRERGGQSPRVHESSFYTRAVTPRRRDPAPDPEW